MENISSIRIFGERCSGTNYLESLLTKNVPFCSDRSALKGGVYGYKHWFYEEWDLLPEAEHILFFVIFRNPVKWLASLNKTPFHCAPNLKNLCFTDFIRTEWSCVWDEFAKVDHENPKFGMEMLHERNPDSGQRFINVLELRKSKLKNWLRMADYAKNIAFLSHEELVKSPESYLGEIFEKFCLPVKKVENVKSYRGYGNKIYVPKPDPVISQLDAEFICENLDWSLESIFGYTKEDVFRYVG